MTIHPLTFQEKVRNKSRMYRRRAMGPVKWLAYQSGQTRFVPPPDRMYIESTNICNLGCIMCPTGRKEITRRHGYMKWEVFKQIVDEMAPHVKATTLHIWGEPLLHKRIFDMVAYCREKGLRAEISTNATLLSADRARGLLDAGLNVIYLCQDGIRPETYENVRINADYEKTNENIRRFVEMKHAGRYQTFVNLQIIEMARTRDETEAFVQYWKDVPGVDLVHVKPFDSWGDQIEEISALKPADSRPLPPRFACPNLWYHVHIYWDGAIAMCDRDFNLDYDLGNVIDADGVVRVMKNWNGPKMQELRQRHLDGEYVSPCTTCSEWAWWKPTLFAGGFGNRPVQEQFSGQTVRTGGNDKNGGSASPIELVLPDDSRFGSSQ
ncbi:MAG: radical SAM protein [Caldilineales bacterium]|nr:radical SAM protein [Caldilineales bacterium]